MLGRPYSISGHIVHGHQQGREWGFPTVNLNLNRLKSPLNGIFAVRVHGLADEPLEGVGYVGSRPIIDDPKFVLEVHIFDFDSEVYGRTVRVEFLERVRDDMNFESFDAMAEQIARDCDAARAFLAAV